jgi:hypothetical protein
MRTLPLTVITFLAAPLFASAQISVEVVLDQEQFLRDEPLPVKVRITNRSGRTLQLGQDNQWLGFALESLDGAVISKLADVPVTGEFTLESARMATREVDLMPCFDVSQPGRYTVTANVRIKEWNEDIASKPKGFEIVRGTKLWEQEFGIPLSPGAPESRKYTLQQASYRKQLKLYLRVTDLNEHTVFRVFPLGPMVSFSQVEAQVDKTSDLYALFQTGARSFLFYVINPKGDVMIRQTYDYTATRPTLRSNDEGRIFVMGGLRRLTGSDVPAALANNTTPEAVSSNSAPAKRPVEVRDHAKPPKK